MDIPCGSVTTLNIQCTCSGEGSAPPVSGGRIQMTAATDFYVSTAGSDSTGDGSSGNPWATIDGAYTALYSKYDLAGFPVTINVADGVYEKGFVAFGPLLGQRWYYDLYIKGNIAHPENVVIKPHTPPTDYYAFSAAFGAMYRFEGFKLDMSQAAQDTLNVGAHSIVGFKNVIFGDSVHPWTDIIAYDAGTIYVMGDYKIEKSLYVITANVSAGSNVLTNVSSFTGIQKYQGLFGGGLPLEVFITDFNPGAGTITLSKPAIGSVTNGSVGIANGGVCHITAGRNGVVAYLTDGQPGIVKVSISGIPYYWHAFQFANGGKMDVQAITWDGPVQGKPIWVKANGIADNFQQGVGGEYPPGNALYYSSASFNSGDEQVSLSSSTGIEEGQFVNGYVSYTATLTSGSPVITVPSTVMIDGGCKVSGPGIAGGAGVVGINGNQVTLSYPCTLSGSQTIKVTGAGIANGTYVKKKVGSVITLSRPAISSKSGVSLVFGGKAESGGQLV